MRVGAAQVRLTKSIPRNLGTISSYIDEAKQRKLDLVVFPECAVTGYLPSTKGTPPRREEVTDAMARVASMARAARMAVVVGASVPDRGSLFNRAVALSKTGRTVATYDKIHLTGGDPRYYRKGSRLPVFRLNGVPFGMQICFDHRFPETWLALADRGARVVAHLVHMDMRPAAWKTPVIQAHIQSRAAENGIFVISTNVAYSPVNHRSIIADPDGLILAQASSGRAQLIWAQIDPRRATHLWLKDRRRDLFGSPQPRRRSR